MEKNNKTLILNTIFLILISIFLIFIVVKYVLTPEQKPSECINVDSITGLTYNACFDQSSKELILTLKKTYDNYKIDKITIFNQEINQELTPKDMPILGETKKYSFQPKKYPNKINLTFDIQTKDILQICDKTKTLEIKECTKEEINLAGELKVSEITSNIQENITQNLSQESDLLPSNLANKEQIFELGCKSDWSCSNWEECANDIQKRTCIDKNSCYIPTQIPDFTRYCGNKCKENWQCSWSACTRGYTTPTCTDKNSCGTEYSKPKKLQCSAAEENKECTPNIECSNWTECNTDYNFIGLLSNVNKLGGTSSRICIDRNNCLSTHHENKSCSVNVDTYTKITEYNGQKYFEIYDKLSNKLIAKLLLPKQDNSSMNIELD